GSGKELFAHAIHSEGDRKFNKFIRVNCAAISAEVLERKLFGEVNGKTDVHIGLFSETHQGTLLLDEVAELSIPTQEKLLHYLKTNEFTPLNSVEPKSSSVHIVTATSQNLEKLMADGMFIEELYYLLSRMAIQIPPLRERKEDIATIIDHLFVKLNKQLGMNIEKISGEAQQLLQRYEWPGNIRELENVLSRAMIFMGQGEMVLKLDDIQSSLYSSRKQETEVQLPAKTTLASIMDDYERSI